MKRLFQKQPAMRALAFFFDNPRDELHLREIARKAGMSPATLQRALFALVKAGLVLRRKEMNATYYKAAQSSGFFALKAAHTLSKLQSARIVELIASKSRGLSSILLYGSAAKGADTKESDYDFLVIAAECSASGLELGAKLGRECNLQAYTISQWKDVSRKNRAFYLAVITNCIPLKGEKPVID
jgi:DNA-binding transcriptional ArsR family regulator